MGSPVLEANTSTLAQGDRATDLSRSLAISDAMALGILTPCVLFIHGYHPFADDAGIYVAGIRKMLDPSLFTIDSSMVVAHTRWSIFSHIFADSLRVTHIPLEIGLLGAYFLSIFAFLIGCLRLSRGIFKDPNLQWGATLFAGALFTLPVAATSLSVMDPYVTARSFSTPFSLFALAACLGRDWKRAVLWFLAATTLHPLMAAYLGAFLVTFILVMERRWIWLTTACLSVFAGCAAVHFVTLHSPLPYGYREAVLTRDYFFLSNWHWYGLIGLLVPLLFMLFAAFRCSNVAVRNLCFACVVSGSAAIVVSAFFVHTSGSFLLARLQPLRSFQLIYLSGILLLGGFFAQYLRGKRAFVGAALLILICCAMLFSQQQIYATSAHIEWPTASPLNSWQQAFLWIRHNTPADAVFAIAPDRDDLDGSDMQSFRATAMRSALEDEVKDPGVVAIFPQLAPHWRRMHDLENGLDQMTDQQRISRLRPAGVSWLLLESHSSTQMDCPFRNRAVLVCKLP